VHFHGLLLLRRYKDLKEMEQEIKKTVSKKLTLQQPFDVPLFQSLPKERKKQVAQ